MLGFTLLAKAYLRGRSARIAVLLFALSPSLVTHSAEIKQYQTDVFGAVAILLLACWVGRERDRYSAVGLWAGFGALWIWFSHPVVFVMAGAWVQVTVGAIRRRNKHLLLRVFGVGLVWGAEFLLSYFLFLRPLTRNSYLLDYWNSGFPTGHLLQANLLWLMRTLLKSLDDPAGFSAHQISVAPLALALVILGVSVAWKRYRQVLWSFVTPVVLVLFAATLREYPFEGRLILFLMPILIVLLTLGLEEIYGLRGYLRVAGVALSTAVLAVPVTSCVVSVCRRPARESAGIRPAFEYMMGHSSDAGVSAYSQEYSVEYYAYRSRVKPGDFIRRPITAAYGDSPTLEIGRRWYVFLKVAPEAQEALLRKLDQQGTCCHRFRFGDVEGFLYERQEEGAYLKQGAVTCHDPPD